MPQVTREQIAQAKQLDLLTYLRMYEPNNLVHFSGNTYCTKEHNSLKISNGKWHWFSEGMGGKTALKYLIDVKKISFVDAVMRLCNEPVQSLEPIIQKNSKQFALPPAYKNNNRVICYLKQRGIADNIIQYCISNKLIYESNDYHNAVFVGYDEKHVPRYAALRGTWQTGKSFKGEVSRSDKRYSFCIHPKEQSNKLIVTESAIDALSVASIKKKSF